MFDSIINLIHLLATVAWLGGAIFMKAILEPALKNIDQREAGKLSGLLARRFSMIAWPSMVLLIITGILKTPSGMMFDTSSQMGTILMVKHILILVVFAVGLTIGMVVVPKLKRAAPAAGAAPTGEFLKATTQLKRLSMTSTVIGVAIICCAAFLW